MVVQQTGVLEINYCPCNGCDRIWVELEKFLEVQQIDRDAEKPKASILVTGDPYEVTKVLKEHGKKFKYFERTSAMNNQEMQIALPPNPVPGILDPHMEAPNSGVLKMNYCPCGRCDGILVELEKFHGVQRIDRDGHKVSIFITGDPYRVNKVLKKRDKKFEYFEKEGVINVSTDEMSMPPEKMDLQLRKPNNPRGCGIVIMLWGLNPKVTSSILTPSWANLLGEALLVRRLDLKLSSQHLVWVQCSPAV